MTKQNTVQIAQKIAEPVAESLGLELWDVRFEKEGASYYLRYFIDKEGGVDINDCENMSRAVDKLLDAADPIEQSYILEVCSPGIERRLTRDRHFERYIGHLVNVRLVRPVEGVRDFIGRLTKKEGDSISIELEDNVEMIFKKGEAAYVRLHVDFVAGGNE